MTVTADAERLRQVVDNLLANVRAHTPPDAAAVVRVRAEGANAVLEIEDAGPGLDSERAAHVFERFYRGDPSRSRDHGGAGLGLVDRGRHRAGARRQRGAREHAGRGHDIPRHVAGSRGACSSGGVRFQPAQRSLSRPSAIRKIAMADTSTG